jgi:DNA topoisomerase-2
MAQDFVGTNNINLLLPNGQFGSRLNQNTAGSPRYIHTALNPITSNIFIKADEHIIDYRDDDGTPVEPKYYYPIIPMIIVNGALGIGTGFSTTVPQYSPRDIVARLRQLMTGVDPELIENLVPWYRGFKGSIKEVSPGKFVSIGAWEKISPTKIRILDLPIGTWTEDYKLFLEEYIDKIPDVKSFDGEYTDLISQFVITFTSPHALEIRTKPHNEHCAIFEHEFKLVSNKNLSCTNMYLYNSEGRIQKYNSAKDIIVEYYGVRLQAYKKRREVVLESMAGDIKYVDARVRFIQDVIDKNILVMDVSKDDVQKQLTDAGYPTKGGGEDDEGNYSYLLNMPVYTFTAEKKTQLENQQKDMMARMNKLEGMTPVDMWSEELDEFERIYK